MAQVARNEPRNTHISTDPSSSDDPSLVSSLPAHPDPLTPYLHHPAHPHPPPYPHHHYLDRTRVHPPHFQTLPPSSSSAVASNAFGPGPTAAADPSLDAPNDNPVRSMHPAAALPHMPAHDPAMQDAARAAEQHVAPNAPPPPNGAMPKPSADDSAMLNAQLVGSHPHFDAHARVEHAMPPHNPHNPTAVDDPPNVSDPNAPPSPDASIYSASHPLDPVRSSQQPVMGMVGAFTDMTLGAAIPYPPPPMHIMPIQPHPVMPIVPPQHVAQLPQHQQRQPAPLISNSRTTACHWVPHDRVGAVIGGHGTVIKSLQEKSGATIQVHNETMRNDHKLFTIFGYPSQIETAIQLVSEIVGRTRSGHVTPTASSERSSHYASVSHHPNPRSASDLRRTMYVPTSCVGLVIGRNGDTIRNLQDRSGADIKVTPDQQSSPGQPNRPIALTGSEDAITMAFRLINDIVVDARSRRHSPSTPPVGGTINGEPVIMEILSVPNEKVGLIIGRKGVAIRELQMRSGAKIQVTKDDSSVHTDGTRPVTITGTRAQVEDARSLIAAKISAPYLASNASGATNNASGATGSPTASTGASAAQGVPYAFTGGYESEFGNGQQSFQPVFEGNDPSAHGRTPMTYVQYVGFNNYPATLSPHHRHVGPPAMAMSYGGQQQQPQQQAPQQQHGLAPVEHGGGGSVNGSDVGDGALQTSYASGGSIDGMPSSPGVMPRDGNNMMMFGSHGYSNAMGGQAMFANSGNTAGLMASRDSGQAGSAQHMFVHHSQIHGQLQAGDVSTSAAGHVEVRQVASEQVGEGVGVSSDVQHNGGADKEDMGKRDGEGRGLDVGSGGVASGKAGAGTRQRGDEGSNGG